MLRILFVTRSLPGPLLTGLAIRQDSVLRRLSRIARIDVVSYDAGDPPADLVASLGSITRVAHDPGQRSGLGERARFAMSGRGLYHHVPAFEEALERAARRTPYDMVWIGAWHVLRYAPLLRRLLPGAKIIADLADDEVRARRLARNTQARRRNRLRLWREGVQLRDLERSTFPVLDVALYVSDVDAATTLERHPALRVETRPNGVDTDRFRPARELANDPVLAFEGTLDFPPNVEGACELVNSVLPRVRDEIPDARALLVGRSPRPEVRALAGDHVEVTGRVDDIAEHLARAAVFVCPLLAGVGQKNKILQAWALGLPIVATPISIAGLEARDGEELIVAEGPEAVARATVELLRDPERRARLGAAGRANAVARYSVERRMDDVQHLVEELATEPARPRPLLPSPLLSNPEGTR